MAVLSDRHMEVIIGTTKIDSLRMKFNVLKTLKKEANTCEFTVYNLSPETRSKLQEPNTNIIIEAGYKDLYGQIFFGQIREPISTRQGVDMVTVIKSGDGEQAIRQKRINESMAKGTLVEKALETIANTLGVSAKDAIKKIKNGNLRGGLTQFVNGTVLSGNAWDIFNKLLDGSGFEASIQDGVIQILDTDRPTLDTAVELKSETGMIGSPEIGEKGRVKVKSLLNQGIFPGRKVKVLGQWQGSNAPKEYLVDGFFRCESVTHSGDNRGQEWYSIVEGTPL